MVGVDDTTVSKWLNGHQALRGKNLRRVAEVLQTTPEWILEGDPDPTDAAEAKAALEVIQAIANAKKLPEPIRQLVLEALRPSNDEERARVHRVIDSVLEELRERARREIE